MVQKETIKYGNMVMYHGTPCVVNTISDKGIGILDQAGNTAMVTESSIDPAPITPETLKRLGFAEYRRGMFGLWNEHSKAICEISSCTGEVWYIIINDFVTNLAEIEKKYVHELQNAFADVMGKRLEIKEIQYN